MFPETFGRVEKVYEDEDGLVADDEASSPDCGGVKMRELAVLQLNSKMSALCCDES